MNMRVAVIATLVGASLVGVEASAQTSQTPPPAAPPMQPILAGKKIVPPIKGAAEIEIIKSPTKREGATLVTKIQAKNVSSAPIARLKVVETWYDKSGASIPGGEAVINGLLPPGDVQTLEIKTPVNLQMSTSQLFFTHANGSIKAKSVKAFDAGTAAGKDSTTKTAAAPAKSSKKKSGG
jgi:hypothetical protein